MVIALHGARINVVSNITALGSGGVAWLLRAVAFASDDGGRHADLVADGRVFEKDNRLATKVDLQLLSGGSVARGREPRGCQGHFADGVLEVSVPLPARPEAKVRKVEIQEPAKAAKSAA